MIHFQVAIWNACDRAWLTWKLIPMGVGSTPILSSPLPGNIDSGTLPSYNWGITGQSTTRTQHVEPESDDFGTIVNEVTVVTTNTSSTVTTRKRYRVADP